MSEEVNGSTILSAAPEGATGGEVISQSEWGAVRELHGRGMAKKAIARELGIDIKTVRKALSREWKPQRRVRKNKALLAGHEEFVAGRAPEVGFNGAVVLRELTARGYEGSYATLQRYLRPLREQWNGGIEPTVRFETAPGRQAQVDWGELRVWIAGALIKIAFFTMVLGFSRRIFARAYTDQTIGSLLDGHARAFEHFGGRPSTVLYDNPKTIVREKDESTGRIVWNPTFKDRLDFYGIETRLCRFYRAQTKGKVESGVKYVKRNALPGRQYGSLEQLNAWLLEWSTTIADERIHGTTHERPRERFEREERAALMPLDPRPRAMLERIEHRRVPRDAYVAVQTNRYPVPFEWVGREVTVRIHEATITLESPGLDPVSHARVEERHQVVRWAGDARVVPRREPPRAADGPPRLDPVYLGAIGQVDVRSLEQYEALIAEVGR